MSVLERVKKTVRERGGGSRSMESVRDRGIRGEKGSGRWRGREVSKYCVKLRGLPWETRKVCLSRGFMYGEHDVCQGDVADFLSRCEIAGGLAGIIINRDERGRAAGDAYVELETRDDMEMALAMHKRDMGSRYIEVFEANWLDVEQVKNRLIRNDGGHGLRGDRWRDKAYTVQLRGLPYKVTEREISDWLSEAAEPVDVIIELDRGRPSGRAECVFSSDREARKVVQSMHRRDLGNRYSYIVVVHYVFPCSTLQVH